MFLLGNMGEDLDQDAASLDQLPFKGIDLINKFIHRLGIGNITSPGYHCVGGDLR